MSSSPIISWQIDGKKMGTMTDFILLGYKITVDGDGSHEIKTLAPWWGGGATKKQKQTMKNLDSVLKSRDITLPIKDQIVKAMVFPVIKY